MLDWGYRILGLVVQARFQIALLVAVVNTVLLLLETQLALESPALLDPLSLLDSPLLLLLAVGVLAQLPPGVVFRADDAALVSGPAPRADDPDESAGRWGCRASAWFRAGDSTDWRLLVPSTLQLSEWGGVEIHAPSYVAPRPSRALPPVSVRTLDWYRPLGLRPPLWGSDHLAVQWQRRRRSLPEPVVETTTRLRIPARTYRSVTAGWQYTALRRYPAIRVVHTGEHGRTQFTYLAFGSVLARDTVLAHLAGAQRAG